jgi:hypothetical protein
VNNDVAVLDELFFDDPRTIRFGIGENLYGSTQIRAFRAARPSTDLARTLRNTVITTYGRDLATAMTEFVRDSFRVESGVDGRLARIGRQSQTWVRTSSGWRVVAAHVSIIPT